ncbi:ATP-dependent zinc metalloprotease FTSH 12, chloroplastic isoform X4 [Quercus suber]|uniref:ATP-dependent zinc metalloprotease FTSH 12, chloroplastic isoform X4 n=1 Tax=Quercus suber TaxID=58331 RepID=UPI0032DFFCD1
MVLFSLVIGSPVLFMVLFFLVIGCSSFWTSWNWENTLCKDIGKGKWLPFVFASGAEFTDIEKSGAARINEMFSIARRNGIRFFI